MAKKALLDVLEQTIGKYVLNLDAESLNVAVWSGKIELNSLQLDCDSVNAELARQAAEAPNLAIPFEVLSGTFEHFEVDVPWAQLMYRPVVLRAKGLTVAVEPDNQSIKSDYLLASHQSEEARARFLEEQRDKSLQLADDYRVQANKLRDFAAQDLDGNACQSSEGSTFASRLVRRIIENLQIEVSDVTVIVRGAACSAGVTLNSVALVTTDKDGTPCFVDRTAGTGKDGNDTELSFLYKALHINGLGVYLDEANSKASRLASIAENDSDDPIDHSYVLAPLSFVAKLRQADSNKCVDYPKYFLASELDSLSIMLSKAQLELANQVLEQVRPSAHVAKPLFPEYRPHKRLTRDTALIWWKYAVRCIGRLNGRRSWVEFFHAFQLRKVYISLYKRYAHGETSPWMKPIASWEVAELREIEKDRSISLDGVMAWRNIADAQEKKEREKHLEKSSEAKSSFFASLFGSSGKDQNVKDSPPIELSVEELLALESFSSDHAMDENLSLNSKLCDARFVLGSFRINLSSYNERPIVSLEMGSVSSSFDANQDGSFVFGLAMTGLEVQDRATPKSFFPVVLKNQTTTEDIAFNIKYRKGKTGDQILEAKLSTFEAIFSPSLMVELKQFVHTTKSYLGKQTPTEANPILAQSMTGSVDLFYDATQGSDRKETPFEGHLQDSTSVAAIGDVSNALVDAWRARSETKASWVVDLDISAPIIVIPENCVAPRANVLVFDLGHLQVKYGKVCGASLKVDDWYKTNRLPGIRAETMLDRGSVQIRNLTFSLGKVNYWRRLVRKVESSSSVNDVGEAIIDPISVSVDLGVEIESTVHNVPRLCAIVIVPSVSVRLSPTQLARILRVSRAWQSSVLATFLSDEDIKDEPHDSMLPKPRPDQVKDVLPKQSIAKQLTSDSPKDNQAVMYARFQLQQLSIKILDDSGFGIEGHLVSVVASTTKYLDASSSGRLTMGWFWVLDRLQNDFPRKQRLIAHSTLPLSNEEFAKDEKYDILNELRKVGAFSDSFEGSVDLAEVTYKQASLESLSGPMQVDPFSLDQLDFDDVSASSVLNAQFTSLFINWNPRAVRVLTSMLGEFVATAQSAEAESDGLLISSPAQLKQRRRSSIDSSRSKAESVTSGKGTLWIKATMDGLCLSLNSALDDLPLFTGKMSSVRVCLVSDADQQTKLSVVVGELVVSTLAMEKTVPSYRTILGLAPGERESFLAIQYYSGSKLIASLDQNGTDLSKCEAFGNVEVSAMRLVYIQAQILALVEYATSGILGALTAQAANSAATVAADLSSSSESKKIFCVKARGFNVLLPQAAFCTSYLSANLGSLFVEFIILPDSGAKARICLQGVDLHDSTSLSLLEKSVQMDVNVSLGPEGVGTKDEQAMKVTIEISTAHFMVTRRQYAQLLETVNKNMGQADLCLRENSVSFTDITEVESSILPTIGGLSHTGVEFVAEPRRLYLQVSVSALTLSLLGVDVDDPIVQLTAVDAMVVFKSFVDSGKVVCQVTLGNMSCDDQRLKSLSRQYRSLIYQPTRADNHNNEISDVFFASYVSEGKSSEIELKIGSPRIVFIPDVLAELLKYVTVENHNERAEVEKISRPQPLAYHEVVSVEADFENTGVETTVVREPEPSPSTTVTISFSTLKCTLLLVDLGSDLLNLRGSSSLSMSSVAETIVLGGIFEGRVAMVHEEDTNELVAMDMEFHGDQNEAFTAFGRDLQSALQILDPTQFSVYLDSKSPTRKSRNMNLKCAVISPVDVVLSMKNIALLNAILSSISDCFETTAVKDGIESTALTRDDVDRIENLTSLLDSEGIEVSDHGPIVTFADQPMASEQSLACNDEFAGKLTTSQMTFTIVNDLQGLDEALLRVTIRNVVANSRAKSGARLLTGAAPFTAFDCNLHTSILSDYFDASTNTWKVFLVEPWELSAKTTRGENMRFASKHPSTTVDLESMRCHVSFSEQFLMSLASANRMWSIYSAASTSALESLEKASTMTKSFKRSMAASAARTFVASLPYAIENHSGICFELAVNIENHSGICFELAVNIENQDRRRCESGSIEYFRFEPPVGKGYGGKRLYGQDVTFNKSVSLIVGSDRIDIPDVDAQLGELKRSHTVGSFVLMTEVKKEGKTTVVHVSSGIDIHNLSCISFAISIFKNGAFNEIGICPGEHSQRRSVALKQSASALDGKVSKASSRFGIPVDLVRGFRSDFAKNDDATMTIFLSPEVECRHEGWHLSGGTKLRINGADLLKATSGQTLFEVTCRPLCIQYPDAIPPPDIYALVIQAQLTMTLIDGKHPSIDFCIKPRSFIINKMPISLTIQTPMPRVFSRKSGDWKHVEDVCHSIEPNQQIEIFTPGPSIAILLKCSDSPVGGTATDWVDGGWIDLPLLSDFRLQEPLQCIFPFVKKSTDSVRSGSARGVDFSIVQGGNGLAGLSSGQDGDGVASKLKVSGNDAVEVLSPPPNDEDWPIFFVTVRNYAVDHIGDILFEQVGISAGLNSTPDTNVGASLVQQVSPSIGAYGTGRHCGRVSLLPQSHIQIRLLHLSMEGDEGLRRSAPFRIDDISLGEGGVDSTQVKWMDGTVSGFSAYRRLVHPYQSEIHLIPEFIVFNGSETHKVIVKQTGGTEQGIDPGKFVPLRSNDPSSVIVTIAYPELGVMSRPVRIDSLGSRVALVKSTDGFPLGSVAIQTVVGARDSRFVVKLGSITFGSSRAPAMDSSLSNLLRDDFLRFRIMWSELEVTLTEARPLQGKNQAILESALDQIQKTVTPVKIDDSSAKTETWVEAREKYRLDRQVEFRPDIDTSVCTVIFGRFTVDWQRVFKEDEATQWKFSAESREPKERSQFSVVVHHVRIRDETPDSPYPIVFDSTSQKVPFLGLVIRSRGRSNLDLVTIDLLELNLAYDDGISEKIYLNTNEDFVWKALDLADRILAAAAEFAGVDIELNWDEEHDGYVVAIREKASTFLEEETIYEPPKSDTVYHIKKSRVSPFTCVISFKRNPQSSRYKTFRDMAGANIMNYFTRKLKFKIDKAELYFSRYELTDVKGPPNLIVDMMFAYYLSRIKAKILTIVTSSSFQDWKLLSMRESGDDAYAEGDIVRATGNVAGTTANFLFKQAGLSISSGVRNAANSLGDGIESATGAIGVRSLGAGVNSVVSGVGDGVGDTISGVGSGTGQVLKSVGQGAGQIVGGLTGGLLLAGKGLGKSVTSGDGRAIATGLAQGGTAIGTGVGQGLESVVTGTAEGVLSVGKGIFSGVRSVGKGIGGAITGKKRPNPR